MNKNMSLINGLECNTLLKAGDKSTDEINKIRTKNKIMNDFEGNSKLFQKKRNINKNFLRKKFIKENNSLENDQKEDECLYDEFFKNHVFQYYYSTIEYLKKYYNFNLNSDYNNNISKNNNTLNINNDYSYDKNLYNVSYIKTSNIKKNNTHFFVNNFQAKKISFIYNNSKNEKDKNKMSGSCNNLEKEDTKKINAFSKEVIINHNLNSFFEPDNKLNNNEFQNLILNINCPSFKPSNYNNKDNNNIKPQSDIIPNKVENKNRDKENALKEEEYSTQKFGKKGWICSLCNNFNFETRIICNRCKALKNPKKIINTKSKINNEINQNNDGENNDWICSKCQNFNYSFRTICNRCKAPKIYQIVVNPVFYQNIIYNNIIRNSPILNHLPNTYSNKFV